MITILTKIRIKAIKEQILRIRAAWLVLILNVLDLILTYWVIHLGGIEGNPLAIWLIETKLAILFKIGLTAFCVWTAYAQKEKTNIIVVCVSWYVAGIYSMVVLFNVATLLGKLIGK